MVDGCKTSDRLIRGYCSKHYQRWRKWGDPLIQGQLRGDDEARFWSKVDKAGPVPSEGPQTPCWVWRDKLDDGGYGWFRVGAQMKRAHRWGYGHFVAPVSRLLEVDHLCFNRACVNFEQHLEVVTPLVNTRRSHGGARKTHCKNGHEFNVGNTIVRTTGGRTCRACGLMAARRYQARRKLDSNQ